MFLIDIKGNENISDQIYNHIIDCIDSGLLLANNKLPSVRQLANSLNINPNTVNKAYKKLAKDNYIYIINKKGYYVLDKFHDKQADLYSIISSLRNNGIKKKQLKQVIDEVYTNSI